MAIIASLQKKTTAVQSCDWLNHRIASQPASVTSDWHWAAGDQKKNPKGACRDTVDSLPDADSGVYAVQHMYSRTFINIVEESGKEK